MWTVFLLGLVVPPLPANDTSMQSPEPSYSDQWSSMDEGSSPFLDLRNEKPEVSPPKPPSVDTGSAEGDTVPVPDRPDTVTVGDSPSSPDTVDQRVEGTQADTSGRESVVVENDTPSGTVAGSTMARSDTEGTAPVEVVNSAETEPVSDTEHSTSPEEDAQESPDALAESTDSSGTDPSDTPGQRQDYTHQTETFFQSASPRDPGAVLQSSEIIGGTLPEVARALGTTRSDTVLEGGVEYPVREVPFWWRYYGWITGGLVVSVMIGMFFWFRRRRVKVIDTEQRPAGDFFQEQFNRRKPSSLRDAPNRIERASAPSSSPTKTDRPDPSGASYEVLVQRMREDGFNGRFEELIQLYYEEGLSEEEIADRTSRGLGEVGLVIDYADRLRKDMDHGKRA